MSTSVVANTDGDTLKGFVFDRTLPGTTVYTDEHTAYQGLLNRASVKHSVGEFVNDQAHTNGLESFWSMLKRGYHGTYHKDEPRPSGLLRHPSSRDATTSTSTTPWTRWTRWFEAWM